MSYLSTVQDVYRKAAETPDASLCCVPQTPLYLPGLSIPSVMHRMNYGCGTTIHPRDMQEEQRVLYVGVGGGLEALQFAYFTRHRGGVLAIDPVAEMRAAAEANLKEAAATNDWFDPAFIEIRAGDALALPVEDDSVDLAAQNCLFNIFRTMDAGAGTNDETGDLERALAEMRRVLKPTGRLVMSDPVARRPIPDHLRADEVLRAQCISGCLTYDEYIRKIVDAGFGSVEIRARRPYRMLDRARYDLDEDLLLESLEICAYKVDVPADGPCVFTGRCAIYSGDDESFDDGKGHVLQRDIPLGVCDKTGGVLEQLGRADLSITDSTWHYAGGGCC